VYVWAFERKIFKRIPDVIIFMANCFANSKARNLP